MPFKEASMQHPTSCGQNILDTQVNGPYTASNEKQVLINFAHDKSCDAVIAQLDRVAEAFIIRQNASRVSGHGIENFEIKLINRFERIKQKAQYVIFGKFHQQGMNFIIKFHQLIWLFFVFDHAVDHLS